MIEVASDAAKLAIPEYEFTNSNAISSGSTDMGDLSCIMPVVHPYAGGAVGRPHGNDYEIKDPIAACVASAKLQLGMLLILLSDSAKRAKKIIDEFKPQFASKEEYLAFVDGLSKSGDRIDYSNGNKVTVDIE